MYTLAYCSTTEDHGCSVVSPRFERLVGVEQEFVLWSRHDAPELITSVSFIPETCTCSSPCLENAVEVREVRSDHFAAATTVRFRARIQGTYRVCTGEAYHVATVDVKPKTTGCALDAALSTCADDVCADPRSEVCQLAIAGHCGAYPEDAACDLVTPVFTRTEGLVELRASASVDFGESVTVVSGALDCDGTPTPVLASAERLTITVKGVLARGWHTVCAGGRKAAFIYAQPPMSCKFAIDAAPCSASVCADESSEACMQPSLSTARRTTRTLAMTSS
jgi:hypothetical protein